MAFIFRSVCNGCVGSGEVSAALFHTVAHRRRMFESTFKQITCDQHSCCRVVHACRFDLLLAIAAQAGIPKSGNLPRNECVSREPKHCFCRNAAWAPAQPDNLSSLLFGCAACAGFCNRGRHCVVQTKREKEFESAFCGLRAARVRRVLCL
ncbi:hypothetical protein SDC9_135612 [bioreactor metagenome]|uniref:Uncharacterized protein n=1 Tax=bioreactor metagenome TaxID=1076179 RepID=A0A645DHK9_9ZZZZ